MILLQKEQTKRRLGDAKLVSSHKISIFDVIALPRVVRQTLGIRSSKSRIITIQLFYVLKANDIQFKLSNKHAYAGKSVHHNIFLTFDVLDDIRQRLNEFTPLSMTLVQLSLTLKIFKRFMIDMNDELMRAKIMFPFMQNSH